MKKEERYALSTVLSRKVLPLLVGNKINFSVLWSSKNLKIEMAKRSFRKLQEANRWFSSIDVQRSVISLVKVNSKDNSLKEEIVVSGKLYISQARIVLILTAKLKEG